MNGAVFFVGKIFVQSAMVIIDSIIPGNGWYWYRLEAERVAVRGQSELT